MRLPAALFPVLALSLAVTALAPAHAARAQFITCEPAAQLPESRRIGENSFARGGLSRRPWIVMIDNHPNAYPQQGLEQASVVMEGLAEGGITRFMALFQDGVSPDVAAIGPVRSTRLYFAQWAMGFHAIYGHAGGSPDGTALVESTDELVNFEALERYDENGALVQPYSWRVSTRSSPHNLFTGSHALRALAEDRNVGAPVDRDAGWLFDSFDAPASLNYSVVDYNFGPLRPYSVQWQYDAESNSYGRMRAGVPHVDGATGNQVRTKNVVVMEVEKTDRPAANLTIDLEVVGSGPALFFIAGERAEGTWRKDAEGSALLFFDAAGNEQVFQLGQVSIAAVPSLTYVTTY